MDTSLPSCFGTKHRLSSKGPRVRRSLLIQKHRGPRRMMIELVPFRRVTKSHLMMRFVSVNDRGGRHWFHVPVVVRLPMLGRW